MALGHRPKTRILLGCACQTPSGYVPIDVSEAFLLQTADQVRAKTIRTSACTLWSAISCFGLACLLAPMDGPVGFFPGSTIGNLGDSANLRIHDSAARDLAWRGQPVLDRRRPAQRSLHVLVPAYDDAAGVTADFNLNLLARINRELGADFDLTQFAHRAVWNDEASQIEMHLESLQDQRVRIGSTRRLTFREGETIHTENSRKFLIDTLLPLFEQTGWTLRNQWLDDQRYFAVLLLSAQ